MQPKAIISVSIFALVLGTLCYLLLAAETLGPRELELVDRIEKSVAHYLQQDHQDLFPSSSRITNKIQLGGDKPFIYKLSATSGRPGQRIDVGFSVVRTSKKAQGRFKTRWKHELRANSLGKLEEIPVDALLGPDVRLAHLRGGNNKLIGAFFLARTDRGILSLVLKGIIVNQPEAIASMLSPTLAFLKTHGHTLMVDESP